MRCLLKYLGLLFSLIACSLNLFSQLKGVTPLSGVVSQESLVIKTYAVVIGISDYQDPAIPDLRFADKDAEAFANYLRSDAGGNLDNDHMKVLINQQATVAQFAIALDWLMEVVKENDQVILYFSGHGDVEKKTITQPGYLLCWDAPARVYLAGGAMALPMFQDIITTLSSQNKAKVIVITDACRSGKLAGSSVGGAQITGANLAKQYANEIKILSCQPNEYSIEGEQWGSGRGAFSYNFINGLYGLADFNKDRSVSVFEIGRYLEDHVPAEVAPVSQLPMILGDKSAMLSQVDDQLLAEVTSGKSNQIVTLSPIESKGIEEQILMTLDSSTTILYQSFYTSLREKVFLQPSTKCADYYYNQLIAKKELNKLYSSMRRNFAAALQDDAQQVMNQFISGDREIFLHTKDGWRYKFKRYPSYLARAAELLGEDHIMYSTLQARRCFFEGFLIALENENPNQEAGNLALQKFNEALRWQKDLPQVYWQISKLYGYTLIQADSMEYYALKAMDLQPGWVIPYELLAGSYLWPFSMPEKAKYYLEKAATIDSSSSDIKNIWGMYYSYISDLDNAEYYYKKAIQMDSLMGGPYINLGILYVQKAQYDKAIPLFSFLIKKYPSHEWAYRNLGTVYFIQGRYTESEKLIRKSLELDSNFMETHIRLADLLFQTGRIKEAGKHYIKATQLNAFEPYTWYHLMLYYLYTGQTTLAEKTINHAINLDSTKAIHWVAAAHFNLQIGNILAADIQLGKAFSLDSMLAELYSEIAYLRIKQAHFEDAIVQSKKSLKTYPGNYMAMIYLAIATTKLNREQEGINWLEKSIQNGAMYPILMALPELESLRKLKEWNLLINKYFSGKVKD